MSPIRLLAIDIDGTLLNSQYQVPSANLAAIHRAHQRGLEIVLVTGRRHTFALPIARQLGLSLWLISSNGAVTKSLAGELFHRDFLPAATARRICAHMDEFRSAMVITFDREDRGALVLEHAAAFTGSISGWMQRNAAFITELAPLEQCLTCDPVQAMFCGAVAPMQRAYRRLCELDSDVTVLRTEYPKRDLSIVDVLNRSCSKGAALARWARHRGLAPNAVAAIGDNFNDIEMLAFAGAAYVMANAADEMRQRPGWRVTASNDDAGVAQAIAEILGA